METYYTYLITNTVTGMKYIGSHKVISNDLLNDGYWGSSKKLKSDITELGIDKFEKSIFKVYPDYKSMFDDEAKLILKHNTLYPDGYNMVVMKRYFNNKKREISKSEKERRKLKHLRKKTNIFNIPEYDQLMNESDYNKYLKELLIESNSKVKILKEKVKILEKEGHLNLINKTKQKTKLTPTNISCQKERNMIKFLKDNKQYDDFYDLVKTNKISYKIKTKDKSRSIRRLICTIQQKPYGKFSPWMEDGWVEQPWVKKQLIEYLQKGNLY